MKNMKSILQIIALLLLSSASVFAVGKDGKDGKKETSAKETATAAAPAESKSNVKLFTYWVTGVSGSNYTISTSSQTCIGTGAACEFTSMTEITNGLANKSDVDNDRNGFSVQTFQAT